VYTCLKKELPGLNYSEPWEAWLQAWPRTQLYLVQVCGGGAGMCHGEVAFQAGCLAAPPGQQGPCCGLCCKALRSAGCSLSAILLPRSCLLLTLAPARRLHPLPV
jgi:hypothetical protein